jgi:transcriptional regulator with XRE-family HTH domain
MPIEEKDRDRIVQAIRTYIARERISREEFAQRTRLGKSTVDKLVTGLFSEKTILQIESLLKIPLMDTPAAALGETAGSDLGGYARAETLNYVGEYVFARPSFQDANLIHAFAMEVAWDAAARGLVVREAARDKKVPPQFGVVYIPRASMHIFILSNESGWLKKVILSQLDVYKRMKGIMLTMGHAFGNLYTPVAMPVVMNKYDAIKGDMVGRIEPGSRMYAEYREDLLAVEKSQYARWVRMSEA